MTTQTLLLPAAYDVVWSVLVLAQLALLAAALIQWSKTRATRGGGLVDLLVIVLLPVIGPGTYLVGRRLAARRPAP